MVEADDDDDDDDDDDHDNDHDYADDGDDYMMIDACNVREWLLERLMAHWSRDDLEQMRGSHGSINTCHYTYYEYLLL